MTDTLIAPIVEERFDDHPENNQLCEPEPNEHPWLICRMCYHVQHVPYEADRALLERDEDGCNCEVCGSAETIWCKNRDIRQFGLVNAANLDLSLLTSEPLLWLPLNAISEILDRHGFNSGPLWDARQGEAGLFHEFIGGWNYLHMEWSRKHTGDLNLVAYIQSVCDAKRAAR
jgi:hypothetical protein